MQNTGWPEFLRRASKHRTHIRKQFDINSQKIHKVTTAKSTKRILYQEMPEPFDYVHCIYPTVAIKEALVYLVARSVLYDAGYKGMGGFYDIGSRVICVTDCIDVEERWSPVQCVFTTDEVVCHELIHYGANFHNPCSTRVVEEEIAYGKSINYLRQKGRSDDFIIQKNMMPYLMSAVNMRDVYKEVLLARYDESALAKTSLPALEILIHNEHKAVLALQKTKAYEIGQRMIELFGDNKEDSDILSTTKPLNVEDEL